MKKSALALATALSLVAVAPAFAENLTGVDPNCIIKTADGTEKFDMTKCPDGKTLSSLSVPATDDPAAVTTDQAANPETPPVDAGKADSQTTAATATTEPAAGSATPTTAETVLIVPADIMKGATVMSASDYIGKRVYDRAGNDIGEVNDLIISNDGKIQATILGVGGFLGIGEKDVAVSVSSVEMVKDGESVKLVVDASKEQLQQAPAFDPAIRGYAG